MPYEETEQIAIFQWAKLMSGRFPELDTMYHIPNGGARRKREAVYLQASGVKKGMPDICLPCSGGPYHALYIELKRVRGGHVTADQSDRIGRLRAQGNYAVVCRGADEAERTIIWYLRGAHPEERK